MACLMFLTLIYWVFVGTSSGTRMDLGGMLFTIALGVGGAQSQGMTSSTWMMPWGSGWGGWSRATSRGRLRGRVVQSCTIRDETRWYRHHASSDFTGTTPKFLFSVYFVQEQALCLFSIFLQALSLIYRHFAFTATVPICCRHFALIYNEFSWLWIFECCISKEGAFPPHITCHFWATTCSQYDFEWILWPLNPNRWSLVFIVYIKWKKPNKL